PRRRGTAAPGFPCTASPFVPLWRWKEPCPSSRLDLDAEPACPRRAEGMRGDRGVLHAGAGGVADRHLLGGHSARLPPDADLAELVGRVVDREKPGGEGEARLAQSCRLACPVADEAAAFGDDTRVELGLVRR